MAEENGAGGRAEIAAFVVFAILTGPVRSVLSNPFYFGIPWPSPISTALGETLAGVAMLAACVLRGVKLPARNEWIALTVLLLPQIASGFTAEFYLHHDAPWGTMAIIRFAAPLWLALLWGLQLVRREIPRVTAGAAIAGVGAFCLMTPVYAYRPALDSMPMVGVQILLGIATAYTWAFAAPRLGRTSPAGCAALFLLMQGGCGLAMLPFLPANVASPYGRLAQVIGICVQAALGGICAWLWFRLLQRMALSAFAMLSLAAWTASVLPGLAMGGILQWRVDAAVVIALAAVVVGVRARVAEEQPVALGLGGR